METTLDSALPVVHAPRFAPSGTQFLPVSGTITDRFLVTYRANAHRLRQLVPAPFVVDAHEGFGFLSVCVLEIADMGVAGTPGFLRFDNREVLYRIGARFAGKPTFLTLRSDTSSPVLAFLGRRFSHYRPRWARVALSREGDRLRFEATTRDGHADALLDASRTPVRSCEHSVFASETQAADFLLGMNFSADVASNGRVRVQSIDHGGWSPRWVRVRQARFEYLATLDRALGLSLTYDNTLAVRDVRQVWRAARWT
jgi:uncharacterized protein YqjF (DUF2071 family)